MPSTSDDPRRLVRPWCDAAQHDHRGHSHRTAGVVSAVRQLVRCEINSTAGRQCTRPARWHLDCHGCTSGNVCSQCLRDWQRRTATAIGADGGPCRQCGRAFATVNEAGTVTPLPDVDTADEASASRTTARQAPAAVTGDGPSLLGRYETYMRGAGLSERWISESMRNLNKLAANAGGSINQVQPEHVSKFLAAKNLTASSRATYFRQFNSFYTWSAKQGGQHITAELPRPREPRGEPRPLSTAQVQRLLETPVYYRTRVMILLAMLAGLRVHEIAKVRGEDIDVEGRQLHVTGKGGVTATLPLHPLLVEAAATMPTHGYWFPANATRPGEHVLRRSVSHVISLACERAGIEDGTAHRLRHWYATTLLHNGADVRTVQTLLRHASLTTTQRYTLVTDERRVAAVDRLELPTDRELVQR